MRQRIALAAGDASAEAKGIFLTGVGGAALSLWTSLKFEEQLYSNILAVGTFVLVVAKICKLCIDMYYDSDSRALKEQLKATKQAQKEHEEAQWAYKRTQELSEKTIKESREESELRKSRTIPLFKREREV
jgi:hypothetical protein